MPDRSPSPEGPLPDVTDPVRPGGEADDVVRLEATVVGRVQGVGFRWFVVREAVALDLSGWVANAPDGSVRVIAEGRRRALGRMLDLLAEGPAGAWVKSVLPAWMPAVGLPPGFAVRSHGHRGD